MKQHWTWLASLLSPNSNKGTLFSPSRQQTLAHIFRETPVRAGRAQGGHRGGHSDPVNPRAPPWLFLVPALPQLSASSFTDSTDALCSPGKSYKRMFRNIPQIKPYLPEQHFPLISLRKKSKMLQNPLGLRSRIIYTYFTLKNHLCMQTMPTIPAKSLWKPHPWGSGAIGNAVTAAAWDTEHAQAIFNLQYILFHLEV